MIVEVLSFAAMHSANLIHELEILKRRAVEITPPDGTQIQRAKAGLRGPAFFPEGLGLNESMLLGGGHPQFMVVGHNFGCVAYREKIEEASREDDKATWRNVDSLLVRRGSRLTSSSGQTGSSDFCLATNNQESFFEKSIRSTKRTVDGFLSIR